MAPLLDRLITAATNRSGSADSYVGRPAHSDAADPVQARSVPPAESGAVCLLMGTTGVPSHSLPNIPIISDQLKREILAGKHVNLAALMIPNFTETACREMVIGESTLAIKPLKDNRLNRNLTIQEYIQAFSIYKRIICEVFPIRQKELDIYLTDIIAMASQFQGFTFYEYHKQFSMRAAQFLQQGIKVDWAVRDEHMFVSLFTGQRSNSCITCHSVSHSTAFCPETADKPVLHQQPRSAGNPGEDKQGRKVVFHTGKPICNNYNGSAGCPITSCTRLHICLTCKKPNHPSNKCFENRKSFNNK